MKTSLRTEGGTGSPFFLLPVAAFCALILHVPALFGQTFTWNYGNANNAGDAGYNRVTPVTGACRSSPACVPCSTNTDGYIAVGRSASVATSDVYVVRTDNNGAKLWEYTYDINGSGGYDVGYSIIELTNGTGFVLTGWTQTSSGAKVFLMKINCSGVPQWTQVYWESNVQSGYQAFGYDLTEARSGNGTTTNPGDIVVCGYLIPDRSPTADALIFRTNSTGNLIWNTTYNNGFSNGFNTNERLEKLTEATRLTGQGTGDIIAVGYTSSIGGTSNSYVLRVNGNTGGIGAAPQGAATYGGTRSDQFYGLVELQNPAERGTTGPNVVLAGFHDEGIGAGGLEIHLVKLNNGDPCDPILETISGDRTTGYPEIPYDIREVTIPFGTGGGGTGGANEVEQWDLVVTGETGTLTLSNNRDAFLIDVDVATLAPVFGMVQHTAQANTSEWGRSLAIVPTTGNRTLGVIMCGELQGANNLADLFLVKTTVALSTESDCEEDFNPEADEVDYYLDCVTPTTRNPLTEDDLTSQETDRNWGLEVCTGTIKRVPNIGSDLQHSDRELGGYALRTAPNPVRSGGEITLLLEGEGLPRHVSIDVLNTLGQTVGAFSAVHVGSEGELRLSTSGWDAGVYHIVVDDGTYRRMLRVVVVE